MKRLLLFTFGLIACEGEVWVQTPERLMIMRTQCTMMDGQFEWHNAGGCGGYWVRCAPRASQ